MSKNTAESALKLLRTNKENGRMKINNPEELMNKLTERYGDKAPDLVVAAITKPTEVMKGIGQQGTTSAKTLEYLAGNEISQDNIQKLGGSIEQPTHSYTIETPVAAPVTDHGPVAAQETPTTTQATPRAGVSSAYGDMGTSDDAATSPSGGSSDGSTNGDTNGNDESSQSSDPWSQLFNNLFSGDLGKMVGAAIALQLANQATLAWGPHYTPFPMATHPFGDRIDHFNDRVDTRSKTERTLDKVADVAHGVGDAAFGIGNLIGAIKGNDRA